MPGYVKDPRHREALEEIKRIVLWPVMSGNRNKSLSDKGHGQVDSDTPCGTTQPIQPRD